MRNRLLLLVSVVLILIGVVGLAAANQAKAADPELKVLAHRGYSTAAPENTVRAFNKAISAGADAIEFDVHFSSTDYPVVIHDSTMGRTTTCSGKVSAISVTTFQKCDAGNWFKTNYRYSGVSEFSGEMAPGFARVMNNFAAKNYKGELFIELKTTPSATGAKRLWDRIPNKLRDQVVFISFSRARLAAMHKVSGDTVRYGWIFLESEKSAGWKNTGLGSDVRIPYKTPPRISKSPVVGNPAELDCDCLTYVTGNDVKYSQDAIDKYLASK